ncbi:Lrp/AsnC family transcriptional regulator [Thermodesulfatator atlanticus]|uniref:Lrp/AsnC family transcriptional regulator n=1 Tax=Thermodesulfatator atlanticus TaxID=501497 RepID=UPI0003B3B358|nr:Lrp/AsnC ligand binding domain-containing protein [Thermodesulfatator atlanticus]
MALKAYILINTQIGKTSEVAETLRHMPEVKRLDIIMGPYDIIAEVETEDHDALSEMVIRKLQSIDYIQHTMTCPVIKMDSGTN